MTVTLIHNPRCSKSRAALELLRERGVEPTLVRYLDEPLGREQLARIVAALGGDAHRIVRVKEAAYGERGLSAESSEDEILDALAAEPRLLERPIALCAERAALGRPPENVLAVLDDSGV